ncbi:uncharacterized protein LOC142346022 [Convolutriloba macropyga]|uniref:uncharacterized protein LOC142346022 n=1 Tax=Convolutriloba macropyga TaxID=536237 RepID=UPI003F51D265
MAFFCPTKHGKSRPSAGNDAPMTPQFPRHITPGQTMSTAQRRSTMSKENSKHKNGHNKNPNSNNNNNNNSNNNNTNNNINNNNNKNSNNSDKTNPINSSTKNPIANPVVQASNEAQMTSSAGRLEALMRRETMRRQLMGEEQGPVDYDLVVTQTFKPSKKEELLAFKNDQLKEIKRLGDWIYVVNVRTRIEGYIPASYCSRVKTDQPDWSPSRHSKSDWLATRRERPKSQEVESSGENRHQEAGNYFDPMSDLGSQQNLEGQRVFTISDSEAFVRENKGLLVVMFDFEALNENDLACERGDIVTLLNSDDPDWSWVSRGQTNGQDGIMDYYGSDGIQLQGFVPTCFTRTYEEVMAALEQEENIPSPPMPPRDLSSQQNQQNQKQQQIQQQRPPTNPQIDRRPNFTQYQPSFSPQSIRTNPRVFQSDSNIDQQLRLQTNFQTENATPKFNPKARHINPVSHRAQFGQDENSFTLPLNKPANESFGQHQQRFPYMGGTLEFNRNPTKPPVPKLDYFSNPNAPRMSSFAKSFVVTERYDAMNQNQITVVPGETVYVNPSYNNFQTKWVLVQSPRLNAQGYVPSSVLNIGQ